ncbi:MAG: hypothetical protein V1770_02030 [bacterium]
MEENKKGIKKEEIIECFLEFNLIFLGRKEKKERLFSSLKGAAEGAAYVLIRSCLNGHNSNTSAQNIVLKIGKESICMPDFCAHSIQEGVKKKWS